MRVSLLIRLFFACSLLVSVAAAATVPAEEFTKSLPDKVGEARAAGAVDLKFKPKAPEFINPLLVRDVPLAARSYAGANGEKFDVQLYRTRSDGEAYSLLSNARLTQSAKSQGSVRDLEGVGTGAIAGLDGLFFYKGATFVFVKSSGLTDASVLVDFARSLAEPLDEGSGEIPVLVKHLPDWETAQGRAVYAVSQPALKEIVPNQPVLDAVSFEGGTEAVAATYEQGARLVIVEYATPQFAFDGDAAATARIAELRGEGKPVPSAYRRVGNYSVFVFDAPTEQAAQLIDKVHYEKDVRWLGENPHAAERHNRAWLNMSTSVIVNTVKATGLAVGICLAVGGLFGGVIFMRRRAQAAAVGETYSDAGGMLRLNLDELNVQHNPSRLVGQGDE